MLLLSLSINVVLLFTLFFYIFRWNIESSNSLCDKYRAEIKPSDVEGTKRLIGKGIWSYLNMYVAQFQGLLSDKQRHDAIILITSILEQYPCTICRVHAVEYLRTHPFDNVNNAESLQRWIFNMHHAVNVRLHKADYSYEQFMIDWIALYRHCASCSSP